MPFLLHHCFKCPLVLKLVGTCCKGGAPTPFSFILLPSFFSFFPCRSSSLDRSMDCLFIYLSHTHAYTQSQISLLIFNPLCRFLHSLFVHFYMYTWCFHFLYLVLSVILSFLVIVQDHTITYIQGKSPAIMNSVKAGNAEAKNSSLL